MRLLFARTRHAYDSYRDFWRLVELSGFETCHVDEIDLAQQALYIVTPVNGEHRPHLASQRDRPRRARVAWWNLERPDAEGSLPLAEVLDEARGFADDVWVSDRYYAAMDPRLRHVVLGSDARLAPDPTPRPVAYDYTHQSYAVGRREAVYGPLRAAGLREGPSGWFEARDAVLRSSRLMLNVHQTPAPLGEPLRFAVAAAYGLPLVSETLADPYPLVRGTDFLEASPGDLVAAVRGALATPGLPRHGAALRARLCDEWTFRRGVEDAARATLEARP